MRLKFHRSLIDWEDDGNVTDYGWSVTIFLRGRHRARWTSTRGTTRMRPGVSRGSDENCNRAVTLMLWPLGHLDVWWEPKWRPESSGLCEKCRTTCPECGTTVDRASGYPFWSDRKTRQMWHDPCPTDEDRAAWEQS